MINFIARLAEDKRTGACCYLLAFALPVGLISLWLLAALAPKSSMLRFHAIQAMLMNMLAAMGLGILYLCIIYGVGANPKSGFVGAVIYLGSWLVLVAGIVLTLFCRMRSKR